MSEMFERRDFIKLLLKSGIVLTGAGGAGTIFSGCERGREISVEKVYDFLHHLDEAEISTTRKEHVRKTSFTIGGKQREVLYEHPDSQVVFRNVPIHKNALLTFGIGINENAWGKDGDGVLFEIIIVDEDSQEHSIYSRYIDPKNNQEDRKWFDEEIDLRAFTRQEVSFIFKTTSGSKENKTADWAGWSEPLINSVGRKVRIKESKTDNIILITVDTLRADHLKCYDNDQIHTPVFDRLAREGIVCKNAFSQTNITIPSHVSILTSLYLKDHQVLSNTKQELNANITTLAEILKGCGYTTAAAVSMTPLTPKWIKGIERGFDEFLCPPVLEVRAGETNRKVFQWMEKNYFKKFFLWIHYFDPHMPYEPPPPYDTLYYQGDPKQKKPNTMKEVLFHREFYSEPHSRLIKWLEGVRDFRYPVSQYKGEISYVDAQLGRLMEVLGQFGLSKKTLMVITSDHGECLGEHNIFFDHKGLYDPTIHIPLIFWYPRRFEPEEVKGLVASVDILPTILDTVGIKQSGDFRGKNILAMIGGGQKELNSELYSEHVNHTQVMIRTDKWKFIDSLKDMNYHKKFFIKAGNIELYDLENDPAELHDVSNEYPQLVSQFKEKMETWLKEKKPHSASKRMEMDQEDRERLR
ncbi:MAG: sulfatase, partial [Deltaproteobacteria bacterium]|nr:sulfatase [Deltaproteobacteria bacterium]